MKYPQGLVAVPALFSSLFPHTGSVFSWRPLLKQHCPKLQLYFVCSYHYYSYHKRIYQLKHIWWTSVTHLCLPNPAADLLGKELHFYLPADTPAVAVNDVCKRTPVTQKPERQHKLRAETGLIRKDKVLWTCYWFNFKSFCQKHRWATAGDDAVPRWFAFTEGSVKQCRACGGVGLSGIRRN